MNPLTKRLSFWLTVAALVVMGCNDENLVESEIPDPDASPSNLEVLTAGGPVQVAGAELERLDALVQGGISSVDSMGTDTLSAYPGASALAALPEYRIGFDNATALGNIAGKAENTFAFWTARDASGNLFVTRSDNNPRTSWVYRESIGTYGDVDVWPIARTRHYHLIYERFRSHDGHTLFCGTPTGGTGLLIDGKCEPLDYREPRFLTVMEREDWLQIILTRKGSRGRLRVFDMPTIAVGGSQPIQLWFRLTDGSVWGWQYLDAGFNWLVDIQGANAVWIGSPEAGDHSQYTIEDFVIRPR